MTAPEPRVPGDRELNRFLELFAEKTGMVFPERKRPKLARDLVLAASKTGFTDLAAFRETLEGTPTDHPVWTEVIEILRVGETYFFRDDSQISALTEHVIPDILERRKNSRQVRLWSAGCATGEEPYSLAILLLEQLAGSGEDWDVSILATDIHSRGLETARQGRFRKWSFRNAPERLLNRYFVRHGEDFEVQDRVKQMVHFTSFNMMDDRQPAPAGAMGLDLILWRNMAIYFHPGAISRVARRLSGSLARGGWLLVSPAEAGSFSLDGELHCVLPEAAAYRKEDLEEPVPAAPGIPPRIPVPVLHSPSAEPFPNGWEPGSASKEKEAAGTPPPPPAFDQGLDRLRKGLYEEALTHLGRVDKGHPRRAEALGKAALALANLGRHQEAEKFCALALDADPLLSEARYIQALVRLEQGLD
ncbi:MAG: protein-glutamate O-methyltransferase CheR, partial [Pseudomonadota bacterium]